MTEKVGIVWNPSKIEDDKLRDALSEALAGTFLSEEDQPECVWFETTEDDPGQGATRDALAAGCTLVIAAGGDGTVRAVAEALGGSADSDGSEAVHGGSRADLAVVPLGTGNLLARNLGVPLNDAQAAFERALTGTAAPLDLGEVRFKQAGEEGAEARQSFVVMVGFGVDAQMIVETDDELKAKAGWLAYVESLGRAASGTEVVELTLQIDDERPRTENAHTMLVANCGSIQGGMTLLPDAEHDDGELDLLLLSADDAGSWLDTMKNMVWDNGIMRLAKREAQAQSSDSTAHLRARSVRVELPVPLVFEVDGDDVGEVSEFEVRVLPAALRVR